MATRSEQVDAILNAAQTSAQAEADAKSASLTKFYEGIISGVNTPEVVALWLKTNFAQDFEAFRANYPQTAPSANVWDKNIAQITALVAPRFVAPEYAELVRSYEYAINPPDGSMPKLQIMCPDGVIRTGKPLKDAVRRWSIELLEPARAQAAPVQSADEFLRDHPELKDTRPPQLLLERFHKEFARFLKSDVGRAWQMRMREYGLDNTARMAEYMEQHGLELTQKSFEIAALAISEEISVTLTQDDIGGARHSGTYIHDAGGNRASQIPMGSSGGMAGQYAPNQFNPDKVWTEAAVRRELSILSAHELRERFADKAFVDALNKYGL
jgi:hypothetical protein